MNGPSPLISNGVIDRWQRDAYSPAVYLEHAVSLPRSTHDYSAVTAAGGPRRVAGGPVETRAPSYGSSVPPCFDVYVWVKSDDRRATLERFIDRYVDRANPGDPRYGAFIRTHVTGEPQPGDAVSLAELSRDENTASAFTLYLRSVDFHEAIVTLTEEGNLVLGVGLDDPLNDPDIERQAAEVLASLIEDLGGSAGIGGGRASAAAISRRVVRGCARSVSHRDNLTRTRLPLSERKRPTMPH